MKLIDSNMIHGSLELRSAENWVEQMVKDDEVKVVGAQRSVGVLLEESDLGRRSLEGRGMSRESIDRLYRWKIVIYSFQ